MKKFTKIITACIAVSLFTLSAFFHAFAAELDPDLVAGLSDYAKEQVTSLFSISDADLDMEIQYCESVGDTFSAEVLKSAKETRTGKGEFVAAGEPAVAEGEDGLLMITLPVSFTGGSSTATIALDGTTGTLTRFTFEDPAEESQSMGTLMKDASVNLVVGMGTVFAVLVFLCWVISLFKYIHAAEEKIKNKKTPEVKAAEPVVTVSAVSSQGASDDEIQAVIAAAIAAYESEKAGSIVKQEALANGKNIRSYRR